MREFVFGNLRISASNIHAARYGYAEILCRGLGQSTQGILSLPGDLWLVRWVQVDAVPSADLPAEALADPIAEFCSTV